MIARMKNGTSEKIIIHFQTITIHNFTVMTNYYSINSTTIFYKRFREG